MTDKLSPDQVLVGLTEYLAGMERATTADEREAAIQVPYRNRRFSGPTWTRVCKVRIRKGVEIVQAHPLGRYVPQLGERLVLTVCGESIRVARGQNGAGMRYAWHGAGEWAMAILRREGFSIRASHRLWDGGWNSYPHRCLSIVADALAGHIRDPKLNVLRRHKGHSPIQYTVEQNNGGDGDQRATRPCKCGGTLFDWGAGWSEGFDFISWHCNGCPYVFTEHLRPGQLYALRNKPVQRPA